MKKRSIAIVLALAALTGFAGATSASASAGHVIASPCCKAT
ncbi:hypothetical protein EDF34_3460 [Cellulomonas sp. PhB150]|nr:hypothetical protein EDF34_3460 [Cellulomonas sp. PhB150]